MPGPRPTATHLKLLRGNPGKRPINKFEPGPEIPQDPPKAPSFLTGYAADEWWRIIKELHRLKLVTPVDVNVLAAYCAAYCRWRTAEETLAAMAERDEVMRGLVIKGTDGNPRANAPARVSERAADAMVRYTREFGMSPAARSPRGSAASRHLASLMDCSAVKNPRRAIARHCTGWRAVRA